MSKYKLAIIMRTDLEMGKGKMCVQAGHASILAWQNTKGMSTIGEDYLGDTRDRWFKEGQFKVVLKAPLDMVVGIPANNEESLLRFAQKARELGLPVVEVRDFGKTQVESNSLTCVAIGPAFSEDVDKVTGNLPLL